MWQATGKSSGSAGPPGSRRAGAAAGAAVLWWVLTAVASQGLALGAPGMSREEAAAVIARSHQWVAGYLETLPNFTYRKTIRVFVGLVIRKPKLRKWAQEMPDWTRSKHRWERRRGPHQYEGCAKYRQEQFFEHAFESVETGIQEDSRVGVVGADGEG